MGAPFPFPSFPHSSPFPSGRSYPAPPRRRAGPPRPPCPPPPQALHALLTDLMAPVADWGPVLLTLRNGMAELQGTLECAQGVADGIDVWCLRGERHAAWLSERGIARIELVEPVESALGSDEGSDQGDGAAVRLSWFDRNDQCLGRVMLPSPSGRDQALLWLRQHGRPRTDACRRRRAAATVPMMLVPHPGFTLVDLLVRGPAAAAWASAAMLHLEHAAELRLDLGGTGAAVRYIGPLGAALHTPAGLQATGPQCSLSLQPEQAVAVSRVVNRDGVSGMLLEDAAGGRLLLQPQGAGAADWFAGVAERVSALRQAPMVYDAGLTLEPSP